MATVVVAHGAWSGSWAWRKMRPRLRSAGHELYVPSYTGLGEREHLASPAINLDAHIDDVLGVIKFEQLHDIVLVGHSYGGMVATGVADRARARIRLLIYLDAFVPDDGLSLFDLLPVEAVARFRKAAAEAGDGWRLPASPIARDTSPEDAAWIAKLRGSQPIGCMDQPLRLRNGSLTLPRAYIYCARKEGDDPFRRFYDRAQTAGWPVLAIDASHSPHVTAPDLLAASIDTFASMP